VELSAGDSFDCTSSECMYYLSGRMFKKTYSACWTMETILV